MELNLPVSKEILAAVSRLDHFQGLWSARHHLPAERLARLREAARIQAVGASCRLTGVRITDQEVAGLLGGEAVPLREAGEVLGYAAALGHPLPGVDRLLTTDDVRALHAVMMGGDAAEPTAWRSASLDREGFDAEGRATGRVFATLPPRMVQDKSDEVLTWLEFELRTGKQHPALVVGAFALLWLSISPFERGNGRLSRLLANRLLVRAGYDFIPYASLEAQLEQMREEYHDALQRSQTQVWTPAAAIEPWLEFFMLALSHHRERVEAKMELERQAQDYPPLQRVILETVREHGNVDAALLIRATGANRNTLKDNLRRLVHGGVLERTGRRRGTRYRMATGYGATLER